MKRVVRTLGYASLVLAFLFNPIPGALGVGIVFLSLLFPENGFQLSMLACVTCALIMMFRSLTSEVNRRSVKLGLWGLGLMSLVVAGTKYELDSNKPAWLDTSLYTFLLCFTAVLAAVDLVVYNNEPADKKQESTPNE